MRFDSRDIFKSTRVAFSFQKLWIQFIGLFVGYLCYVVATYIALILSGQNFDVIWARFGLLPSMGGYYMPWYGWCIYILGGLVFVMSWLISATAVSRAAYMQLKGNSFYTWREAYRFAFRKKAGSVISTPIVILIIAGLIGLGGFVIGLLGRIPIAGELGISVFAVIWFFASLLLVFIILAAAVSFILAPAIIATTDDDAFEGIFQSFSTLFSQPWRLILYEVLLIVLAVFGFGVFAFFAKRAWTMMTTIMVWGMGDKFADLSYASSYLLQNWIYPAVAWSRALLGEYSSLFFFTRDFSSINLPVVMNISSWIFALFMLIMTGFVLAYPLAVFNVGNTQIFLILKKKKDDENLLERKDREEEEEEIEIPEEAKDEVKPEPEKPRKKTTRGRKKSS